MSNAIESLDHLIPVQVAPCSDSAERLLRSAWLNGCVRGGLIRKVAGNLLAVLSNDDTDERLVVVSHHTSGVFNHLFHLPSTQREWLIIPRVHNEVLHRRDRGGSARNAARRDGRLAPDS